MHSMFNCQRQSCSTRTNTLISWDMNGQSKGTTPSDEYQWHTIPCVYTCFLPVQTNSCDTCVIFVCTHEIHIVATREQIRAQSSLAHSCIPSLRMFYVAYCKSSSTVRFWKWKSCTYSDSRMLTISHTVLIIGTLPTIGKCNSNIWTCRSFVGYRVTAAMSGSFT